MLISYKPVVGSEANPLDRALCPKVFDGEFREVAELRVERVVHSLGGEPSRAELAVALDGYRRWKDGSGAVHEGVRGFEDAVPPGKVGLGLDDVIFVGLSLGGGRVLVIFRGRVTDVSVSASGSGESARIVALGPEHALDNSDLRGARYAGKTAGVVDTDAPIVFNPDNLGNYDPEGSARESQPLFGDPTEPDGDASDPWARHWRLGAFWRYVVGNFVPAGDARLASSLATPELSGGDDAVLPPTDVDGRRPSSALAGVLGAYGLDWWADPFCVVNRWSAWGAPPLPCFRIVNPCAAPVKRLRLQPRGETFSKRETNVDAAAMTFSTRGCVNHWRFEGDFREYEAAFELTKLWTDDEALAVEADYDLGNRAHSDYDLSLDHVCRQWGLNEDAAWTERDTFDFADFLGEGIWTKRRRRFFAPYAETDDEPRKAIVEVQSEALTTGWHRVASGNVRLLADRCGIYFDMVDVDGGNLRLADDDRRTVALKDLTHVRVTAIIQSDERVAYDAAREETAGASAEISKLRRDEAFRWVKRHGSSGYAGGSAELVRDDSSDDGPMERLAKRLRSERSPLGMLSGVSVPWIEFGIRAGERVQEIEGRGLPVVTGAGDAQVCPTIRRITYDFASQRTGIELTPKHGRQR